MNRGYGIVLPMGHLRERWWIFDPTHPEKGPRDLAPTSVNDSIDLDGDGELRFDEKTVRYQPSLRLITKDPPNATIEVDVRILSAPAMREASLQQLMAHEIRLMTFLDEQTQRSVLRNVQTRAITFERPVMIASVQGSPDYPAQQLALIDQSQVAAEEGTSRRQLIVLTLKSATLEGTAVKDFEQLIEGILASDKAGPQTRQERW